MAPGPHQTPNNFPGFKMPFGSSAYFKVRMTRSSAGEREWPSRAFFSRPIPCLDEAEPLSALRRPSTTSSTFARTTDHGEAAASGVCRLVVEKPAEV
jgi:hypothetical protein